MATAAVIGGGLLLGGIASSVGAGKQAKADVEAAEIQAESAAAALAASQAQQQIQNERADPLAEQALQAQQAQLALLGQGGDAAAQQAAQNITTSPLVQALNAQNQQNIGAQAAASGVSGGNLLTALQNANTGTIMQAGFGGLGQVAGQQQQGALGFSGLSNQSLGMANQAQFAQGDALGAAASAQGAADAIPWLAGANLINQGTQLASSVMGGGLGGGTPPPPTPAPNAGSGASGALAAPTNFNSFNVAPPLL